jgi:hypothetical protein
VGSEVPFIAETVRMGTPHFPKSRMQPYPDWRPLALDGALLWFHRKTGTNLQMDGPGTRHLLRRAPRLVLFGIANVCNLEAASGELAGVAGYRGHPAPLLLAAGLGEQALDAAQCGTWGRAALPLGKQDLHARPPRRRNCALRTPSQAHTWGSRRARGLHPMPGRVAPHACQAPLPPKLERAT